MTRPPTDRPLTAGDVPLLREGDVLRCTNPHTRAHLEGQEWIFKKRTHNAPGQGNDIVLKGGHLSTWSGIFTFVSRPATSAASEGEWAVSKSDAIRAVDACGGTYSPDEERSGYADGHREALTAALSVLSALPALASPPVSERERELKGALEGLLNTSGARPSKGYNSMKYSEAVTRAENLLLTAQPAGEGK